MMNFLKNQKNVTKKASIDFDSDSIRILDELKGQFRARSNSAIITMLLRIFGELDKEVREELASFCISQTSKIVKTGAGNDYNIEDALARKEQYQNIIDFLTIGQGIKVKEENHMKKRFISNGYCLVPEDWIEITFDRAEDSEYVGVVEVRNGAKFDVPHFYFFSQKPIRFMTDAERTLIEKACSRISEEYKKAMRYCVEAVEDEDGCIINEKEWMSAPQSGIFQIGVHGSKETFPYGAMIYRTDDIAYEDEDEELQEPDEESDEFFDDEEYYEDTDDETGYVKVEI